MADLSKRTSLLLLAVFVVVLVMGGSWLMLRLMYPPFTPPVLPVPNGYDELLQASKLLAPRTSFYRDDMGAQELATVVKHNLPALELVRKARKQECLVPIDWSADEAGVMKHIEQANELRNLARAFAATARLANINNQPEEAVSYGLEILDFAPKVAEGGLMIDQLVANGVYFGGIYSLREQVEQLSHENCLRLLKKLQATPLRLETAEAILRRETAYFRQTQGIVNSLMMSGAMKAQQEQALEAFDVSKKRLETLNLLLQTHLALRAFKLDFEHLPANLDRLAPDYFKQLPNDPFSDNPLVYLPHATGYQLYSVGPNGTDDGGTGDVKSKSDDLQLENDD